MMDDGIGTTQRIVLPVNRTYAVIGNICAGLLVALKSDFFKTVDAGTIIYGSLWIFAFMSSFIRISVAPKAIQILMLRLPIRTIKREKVTCIEAVNWQKHIHILFETGKSERYDTCGINSLIHYCALNSFRVIDYKVPRGKEQYVMSALSTMFDVHIANMSDKI